MPAAFPRFGRLFDFGKLGHFPAKFFLDDFAERDIRGAEIGDIGDEGSADGAGAGIELANAAGDEVDQNVGVANFLEGFFTEFSVQCV